MGSVDYRMARRAALRGVRTGLRSSFDLCDAHPELVRAAKHIGLPTESACPVCEGSDLRLVTYTYGKELKRESGRVRRPEDLRELHERIAEFECYVVEVCLECRWNHLVRSYLGGYKHRAKAPMPVRRRGAGRR